MGLCKSESNESELGVRVALLQCECESARLRRRSFFEICSYGS